MATPKEAQKTRAIKDAVMELLDPAGSGTRTERSILETLYLVLTPEERAECLQEMAGQGYDRAEVANKMNDFEEDHFSTRGTHS